MPDLREHKKEPQKVQTCPTVASQTAIVCLPVKISPFAVTGSVIVECCGEPVVVPSCNHCHGKVNGTCEFTISQKIYVEIPVEFGATVDVGDTYVECGCAKGEELGGECDCKCKSKSDEEDNKN